MNSEDRERRVALAAQQLLMDRPYTLGFVRVGDVQIDMSYQRLPKRNKVEAMAREWDSRLQGVLIISRRANGDVFTPDGGHRVEASKIRFGIDYQYPAMIYTELTPEEEALIFEGINGHRGPVASGLRYRAGWIAGNTELRTITDILATLGVHPAWMSTDTDRTVTCFGTLLKILRQRGAEHLRSVLRLVGDAWDFERTALDGQFILGVSLLIRNHARDEGWLYPEVVKSLSRERAGEFNKRGREIRTALPHECRGGQHGIYRALHEAYNKGRRNRRLSEARIR